jgi:hypothetical protein
MSLHICNHAGELGNMCANCQHSVPHEIVTIEEEPCTNRNICNNSPSNDEKFDVTVWCKPIEDK